MSINLNELDQLQVIVALEKINKLKETVKNLALKEIISNEKTRDQYFEVLQTELSLLKTVITMFEDRRGEIFFEMRRNLGEHVKKEELKAVPEYQAIQAGIKKLEEILKLLEAVKKQVEEGVLKPISEKALAIARLKDEKIFVDRLTAAQLEKIKAKKEAEIKRINQGIVQTDQDWRLFLKRTGIQFPKRATVGQILPLVEKKMQELEEAAQKQASVVGRGEIAGKDHEVSYYLYDKEADTYNALKQIFDSISKWSPEGLFSMHPPFSERVKKATDVRDMREAELKVINEALQPQVSRQQKAAQRGEVTVQGAREYMKTEGGALIQSRGRTIKTEKQEMVNSIKLDQLFRSKVRAQYAEKPKKGPLHYQKGWDKVRNQHFDFLDGLKTALGKDRTQIDSQKAMHYYVALNMMDKILEDEKKRSWIQGGRWDKSMGRLDEIVKKEKQAIEALYGNKKALPIDKELAVSMNYIKAAKVPSGSTIINQYEKLVKQEKPKPKQ